MARPSNDQELNYNGNVIDKNAVALSKLLPSDEIRKILEIATAKSAAATASTRATVKPEPQTASIDIEEPVSPPR